MPGPKWNLVSVQKNETIHLASIELDGSAVCGSRKAITVALNRVDCPECLAMEAVFVKERDIERIMREQGCSRTTAEYVHKMRVEFENKHKKNVK